MERKTRESGPTLRKASVDVTVPANQSSDVVSVQISNVDESTNERAVRQL